MAGKKGSTLEMVMVIAGLAVAADVILTGDMPPLLKGLMNGDTSILSKPEDWFGFLKLSGGGASQPPPAATPPGTVAPAPAAVAGGAATGDCGTLTATAKDEGEKGVNYATGGSGTTHRWNASTSEGTYEAIWCINVGSCADNIVMKLWGPSHSDGACCWIGVSVDCKTGDFWIAGEGPHPDTNSFIKKGASMGSIMNKDICVKGAIKPGPFGAHVEGWAMVGGAWKNMVVYDGPAGNMKKSKAPASGQQVQFRVDCSGTKTKCAGTRPLSGGAGSIPPSATSDEVEGFVEKHADIAAGKIHVSVPIGKGGAAAAPAAETKTVPTAGGDYTRIVGARYATYFSSPSPSPTRYYNGRLVY